MIGIDLYQGPECFLKDQCQSPVSFIARGRNNNEWTTLEEIFVIGCVSHRFLQTGSLISPRISKEWRCWCLIHLLYEHMVSIANDVYKLDLEKRTKNAIELRLKKIRTRRSGNTPLFLYGQWVNTVNSNGLFLPVSDSCKTPRELP